MVLGFVALPKVVVLVAWSTCCDSVLDVDVALFASPLYTALIECAPSARFDVAHSALLPTSVTAEQMAVAPSLNVTAPVGD